MKEYHGQIIAMAVNNERGVAVNHFALEYPVNPHDPDSRTFATGAVIHLVTDWMATKAEPGFSVQFGYDTPILSFDAPAELIEAVHEYLCRVYINGGSLRMFIL